MSTNKQPNSSRLTSTSHASRTGGRFRGLPEPEDLNALAKTYLTEQHKYWPSLVGTTHLLNLSDDTAVALADQFEERFKAIEYTPSADRNPTGQCKEVGAAYVRYSDKNSNVRSLDQQLVNILAAANRERIFVPWSYVFADAAISGTLANRPGYQMLVKAMEAKGGITVAIVDELDRLSRDQEISTKFRKLLEKHGHRLITSQGFDSTNSSAKIAYAITSLTSDLYIDQLKLKVDRGMTDTVKRGLHVSAPPLGYRLVPVLDEAGQPVVGPNRKLKSTCVIDQPAADAVRRIFELYSASKMSPASIARLFNKEMVLGKSTWNTSAVANLLTHELYIGIRTWKRTTNYTDTDSGKRTTTKRPADEQIRTEVPALQFITDELWAAVLKRRKEVSRTDPPTGRSRSSRQSQYATRLFDLYCRDCDKPLRLYHAGKYMQLECRSRSDGKNDCSLTVSKSLRTIDECILAELSQRLLDEDSLATMVTAANEFLDQEANKPPVDVEAIDKQIRESSKKIDRLTDRLADFDGGVAADRLVCKIKDEQGWLADLKQQKDFASGQNFRPEPLTLMDLQDVIADLRRLLQDDVVAAHAVLAKALGPVYVHLGPKRGKRFSWIAELNIDPLPVMVEIAGRKRCPSTTTLEFLRVRSWTISETVTTEIRAYGNAERIAKTVAEMLGAGSSRNMVAIALQVDVETVDAAAALWQAGKGCHFPSKDFKFRRELPASKVENIAFDVVRMIDHEKLTLIAVANKLGVTQGLASRAYKQAKGEQAQAMAKEGKSFKIPPPLKLSKETHKRINALLLAGGMSYSAIAREVGCGHHAVSDAHKRMKKGDAA